MTGDMAADFRAIRDHARAVKDRREPEDERALVCAVAAGQIDARQLSDYHWRVWRPDAPGLAVDFWPRTGRVRVAGRTIEPEGHGFQNLLLALKVKG